MPVVFIRFREGTGDLNVKTKCSRRRHSSSPGASVAVAPYSKAVAGDRSPYRYRDFLCGG